MTPVRTAISRLRAGEVFAVFLRLGCTSFGGPVAHVGFFREECVARRRWLSDADFADLVALCQFLPGPASSQLALALGHLRAGLPGAAAAWAGFTLPSAALMIACALGVGRISTDAGWLHGLKIAAVAVVAQAVWIMAGRLCTDLPRRALAAVAGAVCLVVQAPAAQVALIAAGFLAGARLLRNESAPPPPARGPARHRVSIACLALFLALLAGLPFLAATGNLWLAMADAFYRSGALVFGGGHVVLPLLESATARWVPHADFLAGYGAAQALPGPLFSFAAYLGALIAAPAWLGGLFALSMIYLPSFLILPAALPHWQRLRALPRAQGAMAGANAVVVGLLFAAFVNPVLTSAITDVRSAALAAAAFVALQFGKCPPWLLVLLCGLAGSALFGH
jgi:chromate transporter